MLPESCPTFTNIYDAILKLLKELEIVGTEYLITAANELTSV